jgi:putative transposase
MSKRAKPSVGPPGSVAVSVPEDSVGVSPSGPHYWSGSHTRHRILLHIVFCPKYRRRVLEGALASRLGELFAQCCEVNRWLVHELNVQPDHLHLLLQVSPSDRVSVVVQCLKGGSSRALRIEFPDLEEFLWGKSFWSVGYFCESVGYRDEEAVRRYIKEQSKPEENEELVLDLDG